MPMDSILIKISGELFCNKNATKDGKFNIDFAENIVKQIKELQKKFNVGIVIGGGNFFRGIKEYERLNLRQAVADSIGMLATVMNGVLLQEIFENTGLKTALLSSIVIPQICEMGSQKNIDTAIENKKVIIFVGGTSNPFFSTDTTAVVRALQIGAKQIWKATKTDFVYDDDPEINKQSKPLQQISYQQALEMKLKIMDLTAFTLAQEYKLEIRVFNIFTENALLLVAGNNNFGSTLK